jgi:hypothetical protein
MGANRLAKKCRHSEKLDDISTQTLKCSGDCRSVGVVTTSCEHETVAKSMSRRRVMWKQEFIHHMHILARCHGNRTAGFIFEKMRTHKDQTPTARTVQFFSACEVVSNTIRITFSPMCNFALFTQLDNSSDITLCCIDCPLYIVVSCLGCAVISCLVCTVVVVLNVLLSSYV